MNQPATVMRRLLKTATFTLLGLALIGLEIPVATGKSLQNSSTTSETSDSLADGTYLYGEIPQPNQIGKAYLILQRQQGKVLGAFYYPRSEFSCFTGQEKNNTLSAKSVDFGKASAKKMKINLQKFHQIKSISTNDKQILSSCKQTIVALTKK
ncbi:hypothetical protein IQ274_33920 [Nostoc sp. LEGE 12447]|uniref:hypothetical protein n=1 Tax=Nostoc sp. LEGE 12447 TaxID=1828640 RepID=UPI00188419A3|nr:hypothetical protein [Nostoc sp. LEGE 12447]MBE9003039.1 hypothetical protein [Nostoc sp. LEGE 12447]